jgi:hypothetical protein
MTQRRTLDLPELWHNENQDGALLEASRFASTQEIRTALHPYLQRLIELYEKDLLPIEKDYRSGWETYAYRTPEAIKENLRYISDKWMCCWLVRWLINLIDISYYMNERIAKVREEFTDGGQWQGPIEWEEGNA